MIISRSVVLLALSAGLLPAAADLRMGRRHLQGTALESNVTDTASIADVIEEDGKKKDDEFKNEVAKRSATYQYVDAKTILTNLYGEVPERRTGTDSGITFTEALRYSELNKCFLTPLRDDLELLQVQTALEIALVTKQVPPKDPTDTNANSPGKTFAWVGISKDASLTTTSPEPDMFLGQRLCRAGNWKNLFDGSDLGGYKTGDYMDCAPNCPGGCWLSEEDNGRNAILDNYWSETDESDPAEGEPDNGADNMMRYNKLETKAMMKAKDKRLYDTHGGNIVAARGAIYMCKVEMEK